MSNFQPLGWTADGSYTKSKYQSYFFDNVEDFKLKLMTGEFDYFCLAAGDANEEIISYVNKKIQETNFRLCKQKPGTEWLHWGILPTMQGRTHIDPSQTSFFFWRFLGPLCSIGRFPG